METNEIFDTLNDVVVRLNDLGVEYMVTGSVAMSSYVTARATMDIDVIIEIEQSDIQRFAQRFSGDYYVRLESIRRARERYSMFNVLNFTTGIKVDFITRKPNSSEAAKFHRRRLSRISETEFWVISKEDLILSKLWWARDSHSERQFEDVRRLIESGSDAAMINNEVEAQGLSAVPRMEDTSEEIRALQQAHWMTLSEEERYRRCGRMFQMTKRFVEARAPQGLNQEEMKRFVFKEIYGFDMPDRR